MCMCDQSCMHLGPAIIRANFALKIVTAQISNKRNRPASLLIGQLAALALFLFRSCQTGSEKIAHLVWLNIIFWQVTTHLSNSN